MKVAVEVVDARDLQAKDGHNTASPYVEAELDGQKRRTQTKIDNLNPTWNETLFFDVLDPLDLPSRTIHVSVFHDRASPGGRPGFLGLVRLSGSSVTPSRADAALQRCPLDRRPGRPFSRIRGDIALRLYAVPNDRPPPLPPRSRAVDFSTAYTSAPTAPPRSRAPEFSTTYTSAPSTAPTENMEKEEEKKKKKKKKSTARTFHSIGSQFGGPVGPIRFADQLNQDKNRPQTPPAVDAEGPTVNIHPPAGKQPPTTAASTGTKKGGGGGGGDKITATYDLVEQMTFLYVNIVKARDLSPMDITGGVDPYVEVRVGNYYNATKPLRGNQSPEWHQVFAFASEHLQSNHVEVTVKDENLIRDGFVGKVRVALSDVPRRTPPGSPLAPQWYRLEDKQGYYSRGEIMMAMWKGTQTDEAYTEASHSDTHGLPFEALVHTHCKVYFVPRLCYLRLDILSAQDLIPLEPTRLHPDLFVRAQLGTQHDQTRISPSRSINPTWNHRTLFVAAEPRNEPLLLTVLDRVAPSKHVPLARLLLSRQEIALKADHRQSPPPKWFSLSDPSNGGGASTSRFASKIQLRVFYDAGYHVLDEMAHYCSDFRPNSRQLWKQPIGVLELGIRSGKDLLPVRSFSGAAPTTGFYCVAKYGPKWVRTRTLVNTLNPKWHEQYTWEVFDPCTVLTVAVYHNNQLDGNVGGARDNGSSSNSVRDQPMGKLRIRVSTLEAGRAYSHRHPLHLVHYSGIKRTGELHLAVRFTCTAWVNMMLLYTRPALPKQHYVEPIPVHLISTLRHHTKVIIMARLARAEPPLGGEVVEYVLEGLPQSLPHVYSFRKSLANWRRAEALLLGVAAWAAWVGHVREWRSPLTTLLVHANFWLFVQNPDLIVPVVFIYLFGWGVWNYRERAKKGAQLPVQVQVQVGEEVGAEEADEEFDEIPTRREPEVVRMRYDRLRLRAGRVQTMLGDVASQAERFHALLSWRDPRATGLFAVFLGVASAVVCKVPFWLLVLLLGLYYMRHPVLRSRVPPAPVNFFKRLTPKVDVLL